MKNLFKNGIWGKTRIEEEQCHYYDSYTGLGNVHLLKKVCSAEQGTGGRYAFAIISLNRYNHLNTLFGLEITGNVIQILANQIKEYAEDLNGAAFRLQLNQLAVLIPYTDKDIFLKGLEQQMGKMEQVYFQNRDVVYQHHYTFTYLVCYISEDKDTIDIMRIVEHMTPYLDSMTKLPKTYGEIYNEIDKADRELQKALMEEVEQGWANKEFIPYYQLLYNVETNRPIGAEILARWQHPERGLMLPKDFLPVLESKGYIMNLDLYMLEEGCKKIKDWLDHELISVPITVNISKLNLHRQNFVENVIEIVKRYEIPPNLIVLEIEEGSILYELNEYFLDIMARFHEFGFILSVDHFGASEYSSINLLRAISVDAIKLNARFFPGQDSSEQEATFVKWVMRLAKNLGIKMVGENIETPEDAQRLTKYGCEYAQGFYFSKPMSNEEFEDFIF